MKQALAAKQLEEAGTTATREQAIALGGVFDDETCLYRFPDGSAGRFIALETATGALYVRKTGADRDEHELLYQFKEIANDAGC